MIYLKPSDLNATHVGKFVHLDFGKRSFAAFETVRGQGRPLDTVTIEVMGKDIIFIEHRVDDGFNEWFKDQYLESVTPVDGLKLRLTKSKLLDVSGESVGVESYFEFFVDKGKLVPNKSFTQKLLFKKDRIVEVLVKEN